MNKTGSEVWRLQPKVEQNTHSNLSSRDFSKGDEIKCEEGSKDLFNLLTSDRSGDKYYRGQGCDMFV